MSEAKEAEADEKPKIKNKGDVGASISLPLDLLAAFPGMDASGVSVLIVGGLGKGIALAAGVDNGDGTATVLAQEIALDQAIRMRFPPGSSGPHTFAVTAISNDGHVKTGSMTVEPSLSALETGLSFSVEGPVVIDNGPSGDNQVGFPVGIIASTARSKMVGSIEMHLSGVPDGVHLIGGIPKDAGIWSIPNFDVDGLNLVTPENQAPFQVVLHVLARGQAGGQLRFTRTALVGLAEQSVIDPALAPPPMPPAPKDVLPRRHEQKQPSATGSTAEAGHERTSSQEIPSIVASKPRASDQDVAKPRPAGGGQWLLGQGVFTFASGHGGDLFEGGYGWYARPPERPVSFRAVKTSDDDEKDDNPQLRVMGNGPVVNKKDPVVW